MTRQLSYKCYKISNWGYFSARGKANDNTGGHCVLSVYDLIGLEVEQGPDPIPGQVLSHLPR